VYQHADHFFLGISFLLLAPPVAFSGRQVHLPPQDIEATSQASNFSGQVFTTCSATVTLMNMSTVAQTVTIENRGLSFSTVVYTRRGDATYPALSGWTQSGSDAHYAFQRGNQPSPTVKTVNLGASAVDTTTGRLTPTTAVVVFKPLALLVADSVANQFTWDHVGGNPPLPWSDPIFYIGPNTKETCQDNDFATDPTRQYLCAVTVRFRYRMAVFVDQDRGAVMASVTNDCYIANSPKTDVDRTNVMLNGGRAF